MSSAEGLKQRKGAKKEEDEKPLLDKEDKPKPVVRFVHACLERWRGGMRRIYIRA